MPDVITVQCNHFGGFPLTVSGNPYSSYLSYTATIRQYVETNSSSTFRDGSVGLPKGDAIFFNTDLLKNHQKNIVDGLPKNPKSIKGKGWVMRPKNLNISALHQAAAQLDQQADLIVQQANDQAIAIRQQATNIRNIANSS